jgi:hypothetical protein
LSGINEKGRSGHASFFRNSIDFSNYVQRQRITRHILGLINGADEIEKPVSYETGF